MTTVATMPNLEQVREQVAEALGFGIDQVRVDVYVYRATPEQAEQATAHVQEELGYELAFKADKEDGDGRSVQWWNTGSRRTQFTVFFDE